MSWLDWFMSNKAPIGFIFTVIGTGLITSSNPRILAWGAGLMASGAALIGGGVMKSDHHYKEKAKIQELGNKEEIVIIAEKPVIIEQKPSE